MSLGSARPGPSIFIGSRSSWKRLREEPAVEISPGCRILATSRPVRWRGSTGRLPRGRGLSWSALPSAWLPLDAALQVKEARASGWPTLTTGSEGTRSWPSTRRGGDYTVELWDFTYQGNTPMFFPSRARLVCSLLFLPPPGRGPGGGCPLRWNLPGSTEVKGRDEPSGAQGDAQRNFFPGAAAKPHSHLPLHPLAVHGCSRDRRRASSVTAPVQKSLQRHDPGA